MPIAPQASKASVEHVVYYTSAPATARSRTSMATGLAGSFDVDVETTVKIVLPGPLAIFSHNSLVNPGIFASILSFRPWRECLTLPFCRSTGSAILSYPNNEDKFRWQKT